MSACAGMQALEGPTFLTHARWLLGSLGRMCDQRGTSTAAPGPRGTRGHEGARIHGACLD
jgi:hypothetical protein